MNHSPAALHQSNTPACQPEHHALMQANHHPSSTLTPHQTQRSPSDGIVGGRKHVLDGLDCAERLVQCAAQVCRRRCRHFHFLRRLRATPSQRRRTRRLRWSLRAQLQAPSHRATAASHAATLMSIAHSDADDAHSSRASPRSRVDSTASALSAPAVMWSHCAGQLTRGGEELGPGNVELGGVGAAGGRVS